MKVNKGKKNVRKARKVRQVRKVKIYNNRTMGNVQYISKVSSV